MRDTFKYLLLVGLCILLASPVFAADEEPGLQGAAACWPAATASS